ncbi:hypothetical protein MHBO_001600 [Bonamia ostreae]|uniref:BZIP domain-containing protein n=1 Tax=Bonamia ostreae TaxID=126728 RepID=A0ABV2AK44_9EUKA
MSQSKVYLEPILTENDKGEAIIVSAYTRRQIKTYPGESHEKRCERLKRNFETARKNRQTQKKVIESLKARARLLKDENEKIRSEVSYSEVQKTMDHNNYAKSLDVLNIFKF